MQSNIISSIDARTFAQIWKSLLASEKDDLSLNLYKNHCCRTRQTIWNWANEKTSPVEPLVREGVAKVVSKFLNARVSANTLFPRQ